MINFIKGIDVSAIQGPNLNWQQIANSGIQFVIHRVGVGNNGIDSLYVTNIQKAIAAGLKVAAYNFIFPLPTIPSQPLRDPVRQAQYHWQAVKELVPISCCDFEWPAPQDWQKWNVNAQFITDWTLTYLQEYERLSGQKPVIYTYPDFANHLHLPAEFAQYKLWIASYQANSPYIPHPWTDWVLWQNYDHGHLPNGVEVDTDLAKDLSLWDSAPIVPVVEPLPPHQPDPPIVVQTQPQPVPVPSIPIPPTPVTGLTVTNMVINWIINLFKKTI